MVFDLLTFLHLLAVVVVAGALVWAVRRPGPAPVTEPVRRDVVEVVVASGRLQAIRETQVGAEAAGIVESLAVNEGAVVRAGDLLGLRRRQGTSHRGGCAPRGHAGRKNKGDGSKGIHG